ncbi:universal stress protein [Arsenicitalea aurantiaca]|uniref:Universal stress protein n=1 Tax=Arsenicitalea aurantiaca TaxID=1783274 RepID=A0A433X801_9HYPH|nr:universal stress protein [Arsenicitalea aurantiaca]RUT30194.1 universal stress protein [Arsenicitalea aurantiaca]
MTETAPSSEYKRKFLVVIDDTEECDRALTFAAYRVRRTGGTVVLLSVIDPPGFHGLGVEDVLRAEALEEAEAILDKRIARLKKIGNIRTETVIREGRGIAAIEQLIEKDRDIAILVLAASASGDGPGPLVTAFATRSGGTALRIPITIVPGTMTDEEIIAVC